MLTPVDIQQKKFKSGLGYDKKDVKTFFAEVSKSYEELYRSNAELKEKVITLTDGLQHYKVTEDSLQKSLMLAEKNKEESKSNAVREAKNIELEAKNRANEIVSEAYGQLEELESKMQELESRYAEYKSNFAALVKQQFELLELKDFDPDAHIDPNYVVGGFAAAPSYSDSEGSLGGGFSDDPQMRDSGSGLGASAGASSAELRRESNRSSTTSVYGATLGGSGIDPFGEGKANTP
jgi:DivIVA domain-containing protein